MSAIGRLVAVSSTRAVCARRARAAGFARLQFKAENPINDGLRVNNTTTAATGLIRFAGASPTGFTTLVLYDGTFQVKSADYAADLALQMEELSAALSLTNLTPQLRVNRQIFLSRSAGH